MVQLISEKTLLINFVSLAYLNLSHLLSEVNLSLFGTVKDAFCPLTVTNRYSPMIWTFLYPLLVQTMGICDTHMIWVFVCLNISNLHIIALYKPYSIQFWGVFCCKIIQTFLHPAPVQTVGIDGFSHKLSILLIQYI